MITIIKLEQMKRWINISLFQGGIVLKQRNWYLITKLGKLAVAVVLISILFLSVQTLAKKDLTGGKVDKSDVIYAIDGYLADSEGNQKPFLFGALRLHKRGAWEDESTQLFYFEFDNKITLGLDTEYDYFMQPKSDGTNEILPYLKSIRTDGADYRYVIYDSEEYAEHGLAEGTTPHEFEINLAFTKNGEIDTKKSSIGIVPKQYQTGRPIKTVSWRGAYYKKGSNTERFVPQRDAEGKVTNMHEAGEPIYEEDIVNGGTVCDEFVTADTTPASKDAPVEEKDKIPESDGGPYYRDTGLCSTYKVQSISRSTGLPDAYALGLIKG